MDNVIKRRNLVIIQSYASLLNQIISNDETFYHVNVEYCKDYPKDTFKISYDSS